MARQWCSYGSGYGRYIPSPHNVRSRRQNYGIEVWDLILVYGSNIIELGELFFGCIELAVTIFLPMDELRLCHCRTEPSVFEFRSERVSYWFVNQNKLKRLCLVSAFPVRRIHYLLILISLEFIRGNRSLTPNNIIWTNLIVIVIKFNSK